MPRQVTEMDSLNFVVFLGSSREGRMATRVGKYIRRLLEERNHNITIIDPLDVGLGQVISPLAFMPDPSEAPANVLEINKQIQEADGFIIISPEYNATLPPALCSMMDNIPPVSFAYRPSAIVTYSLGNFGGMRAGSHLRQFLSDLTTISLPHIFMIPMVEQVLNENGEVLSRRTRMQKMSTILFNQLEWYSRALKNEKLELGIPAPSGIGL
ncbi:quinone reductase-like [Paramacrobiotus metropolitanus]|uniref:quinone reductase-like n=1 Tax=Paramacrobiotus metropolitanus TaxID=2943436 RepID=UPI0024463F5A|nr:quinone reductase-like [Paramacrobiotus metropolitanus]XP_055343992.1 quinone reductase-like [Paramacrobiotus metropolitanus]XP_055343993.1 quinone reductase-like [Paramacrobiotus metropolitanus]